MRAIDVGEGKKVILVRIHRSWLAPHRVTFRNHGHFYGRGAAGKFQLDVDQLRAGFTLSEGIADRVRAFQTDRLIKIKGGMTPVPVREGSKVVLHMLPLSAFAVSGDLVIDLKHLHLPPMGNGV